MLQFNFLEKLDEMSATVVKYLNNGDKSCDRFPPQRLSISIFPLCPAYFTGLEDSLFFHHQTSEAFETTHVSRDSRVSNQNFQVLQRNVFTCVSAIAWCRPTVWILRFDIFDGAICRKHVPNEYLG